VNHPDEIWEIFDSISYAKGASVIRMLASYIGMESFLEGMRVYLTRHAYRNAVTNDLWKALEEVSGKPCVELMAPWVLEMGYPILLLSDDGTVRMERYLAGGPDANQKIIHWPTPVTAKVEGMDHTQGPWVVNGPDGDESEQLQAKIKEWIAAEKWFKLNVDQTGFFRVSYTENQFVRLASAMKPSTNNLLSTADRLGLISDSFAAGKAGYSSIVDSLALIEGFGEHETIGKLLFCMRGFLAFFVLYLSLTMLFGNLYFLTQSMLSGRSSRKTYTHWPNFFEPRRSFRAFRPLFTNCIRPNSKSSAGSCNRTNPDAWVLFGLL
jgi:aminopeptidase 2